MKKYFYILFLSCALFSCENEKATITNRFIRINGPNLITPDGEKFFIQGTCLGTWLNPEGYMLSIPGSFRKINDAFCEMVGPDFTAWWWREFIKNYVTREDIAYIKSTGMNTIRLPFHYKMFTFDSFMGSNSDQDGFEIIDQALDWCRDENLYVILDMHAAPGGNTGDAIDDGYFYPWLFESEESQALCCDIWKRIAERYANDTIVLGYDLLNEPLHLYYAHLNDKLEPFHIRCTKAIREVDNNHIVILSGAEWSKDFSIFTDWTFDEKIMYTPHLYWVDTIQSSIQHFVDFRDKVNLPMWMGETGANTDEWCAGWIRLLERNNISWTVWPYKKMPFSATMVYFPPPENWNLVQSFCRADRGNVTKIRDARPDQAVARKALTDILENMKFANCSKNEGYTEALGMKP